MGVGKSSVGRALAARLGREFVDNDIVLEAGARATAGDLASRQGLDRLHEVESEVLRTQLLRTRPAVVATAASVVLDADNRRLLRERACIVWLRADPELLTERMATSSHRPHVGRSENTDPQADVHQLMRERDGFYAELADVVIDTSALAPHDAARAIVAALDLDPPDA